MSQSPPNRFDEAAVTIVNTITDASSSIVFDEMCEDVSSVLLREARVVVALAGGLFLEIAYQSNRRKAEAGQIPISQIGILSQQSRMHFERELSELVMMPPEEPEDAS